MKKQSPVDINIVGRKPLGEARQAEEMFQKLDAEREAGTVPPLEPRPDRNIIDVAVDIKRTPEGRIGVKIAHRKIPRAPEGE
jgi:hypothetical protein